jgi:methylated-DNA-[protein]-cysteine S-methyltransferase
MEINKINRSEMEGIKTLYYESPLGLIEIQATEIGVRAINFAHEKILTEIENAHNLLAISQLDEYFNQKRRFFDMPLDLEGTDFQKRVWTELLKIPFGKTCSYMDIARAIGDPKTIRAVGMANGSNKIAIVVPCHRVIGSDGSLTGYAAGLTRKKWLLDLESPTVQGELF